jgi:cobyrinic acid a,c-diamide synthase
MRALRTRGHTVAGFKVGPDFIDPSYHALATGRPGRNLDAFLSGPELIAPLFAHGSSGCDIAVIEGVMGMFDGKSGGGELASTAHVARLLRAPVLLVVDARAMSRSVAALVHGFTTWDPDVHIAGIVLNRVGSDTHDAMLREALTASRVPVVGVVRRRDDLVSPSRHLGLVPAAERRSEAQRIVDALGDAVTAGCDVDAVAALARAAPDIVTSRWDPSGPDDAVDARIAVASGKEAASAIARKRFSVRMPRSRAPGEMCFMSVGPEPRRTISFSRSRIRKSRPFGSRRATMR